MERMRQWLVWNPEGGSPRYRHATEKSARSEAARLARNNPGREFYVLVEVCMVKCSDLTVVDFVNDDDLPF